ncbi:stalk domain-containing protein [Paenibacillus gansuensis]|uniref:Stalk domain-containing protein n=1 Tax=Paenibacillus gansuensis TaxID=306542 RepID=A0ABW5PGX2_9BACL
MAKLDLHRDTDTTSTFHHIRKAAFLACTAILLTGALAVTPVQASSTAAASSAGSQTGVMLDGYALPFPSPPSFQKGVTMVPFRAIAEALNISVQWSSASKKVTANGIVDGKQRQVVLTIGRTTAVVDGSAMKLAAGPIQINGNVLVPLNFFSSQFGAQVSWNPGAKQVEILSPKRDLHTRAFYAIRSFSDVSLLPQFDSVSFGWTRLDAGARVVQNGAVFNWPQPSGEVTAESIVGDAAAAGTETYLMVFADDAQGELSKLLRDASLRDAAADELVRLASENGFQGIQLDFEGLGRKTVPASAAGLQKAADDQKELTDFVSVLSGKAKSQGLKLSLALQPLNGWFLGYDYAKLGAMADDIVVMAYAYGDEKSPEPLRSIDEAIRLTLKQVPKEKVMLGVSFASENETSLPKVIGLAKRYNLKGAAFWRLGLPSQAEIQAVQKSVE